MSNPGRNDPCLCGSGKKYKKCCLPLQEAERARSRAQKPAESGEPEEPFIAELRPEVDEAVAEVLERMEMGAGRTVEPELKALLGENPGYHTPQFAMGVYLAFIIKDYRGAVPFFEEAVKIFPPFPEAHFNLGNAARQLMDIPKAVKAYRAAIRYSRADDGMAEMAGKELRGLEGILLQDTLFPNLDAYLANAGLFDEAFVCLQKQDFARAVELFNRVLLENPQHVQSFGNLGLAHAGLGHRAAALGFLDRALALDPGYEPARGNRVTIASMREGVPFIPEGMREIHYYQEKVSQRK